MSKLMRKQPDSVRGGRSVTVLVVNDIVQRRMRYTNFGYWLELITDLVDRDREGFRKYGQNLETHDGRYTLSDLQQEVVDAIQYARKDIEEREIEGRPNTRITEAYELLITVAEMVYDEEDRRNADQADQ